MNMNTALQNLYKAVSGEDNHKRNISKLLCDIHYAITGQQSSVKNNYSRIIDSMAANWPSGSGGGGSSDFSTANVTIDIGEGFSGEGIIAFDFETGVDYLINDEYDGNQYAYSAELAIGDTLSQNPTELPSINTIPLLLYRGQCYLSLPINGVTTSKSYVRGTGVSVTGNATLDQENSRVIITGDCTITVDNWVV